MVLRSTFRRNTVAQQAPCVTGLRPDKPALFLGGSGRSGTHLLRKVVGRHPWIAAIPNETKLVGRSDFREAPISMVQASRRERHALLERIKQKWLREFFGHTISAPTRPGELAIRGLIVWVEKEELVARLPQLDALMTVRRPEQAFLVWGRFLDSIYSIFSDRKGKPFWMEKTSRNSMYADFLYRCFPNLKLINIERDGRDVACSVVSLPWGPNNYREALDWWGNRVRAARRAMAGLPPGRCLDLRYENLVGRPDETKHQIWEFLGVPPHAEEPEYGIHSASVGRWRLELPAEAATYARSRYGDLLTDLGYSLD